MSRTRAGPLRKRDSFMDEVKDQHLLNSYIQGGRAEEKYGKARAKISEEYETQ